MNIFLLNCQKTYENPSCSLYPGITHSLCWWEMQSWIFRHGKKTIEKSIKCFSLIFSRSGFEAQGCPESCTLCLRPWPLSKVSARHACLFQTLTHYRSGKLTVEVGLVLRNESSCTSEARHSKTIPQYGGGGMTPAGIWPDSHFKYVIVDLLSILANNNERVYSEWSTQAKTETQTPDPHYSCVILWHHSVQMLKTYGFADVISNHL